MKKEQIYKVVADKYVAAVIQGTYQLSLWLMNVPRSRMDTLVVHSMTGTGMGGMAQVQEIAEKALRDNP